MYRTTQAYSTLYREQSMVSIKTPGGKRKAHVEQGVYIIETSNYADTRIVD